MTVNLWWDSSALGGEHVGGSVFLLRNIQSCLNRKTKGGSAGIPKHNGRKPSPQWKYDLQMILQTRVVKISIYLELCNTEGFLRTRFKELINTYLPFAPVKAYSRISSYKGKQWPR